MHKTCPLMIGLEHLIEFSPNGERDLAYEIAFAASLTRNLLDALSTRITLFFNYLAYRLL